MSADRLLCWMAGIWITIILLYGILWSIGKVLAVWKYVVG